MTLSETALLLIDVQKGFDDLEKWGGRRNNLDAEENIARLLEFFREYSGRVIHIRHSSLQKDSPLCEGQSGYDVKPQAHELPTELIIKKHTNSAFIGTDLEGKLHAFGVKTVIICGVQTDHCCSTTDRMAANLGFQVLFVDDANWTYDRKHPDGELFSAELVHRVNIASLYGEFAQIVSTDYLINAILTAGISN